MDADGDFVVTWQSATGDGGGFGIRARLFDAAATPKGPDSQVNDLITSNAQLAPSAGMDRGGDFVIAWQSDGGDRDGLGIRSRVFHASGVALGSEFLVNNEETNSQLAPDVGMDADGNFIVVWPSNSDEADATSHGVDNSNDSIQGRLFNAVGDPQGDQFLVNTVTEQHQQGPEAGVAR